MKITLEFVANDALDERVPVKTGESFIYKHGHLATAVFDFGQDKDPGSIVASDGPTLPEWASAAMARSCEIQFEGVSWASPRLSWDDVQLMGSISPSRLYRQPARERRLADCSISNVVYNFTHDASQKASFKKP
ncbi:MAG TPA: hypothetical protein VFH06_05800 [Candidatus Saccharimonadales bacterium]|nr:hypothetical protein [Candidatus Saccharimonadales bacterium]